MPIKKTVVRPWPVADDHKIPFVPAIKVSGGELLFISGMGALPPVHRHPHVPEEWILPDDAAEQARRALDKIKAIVEKAGGQFGDIVKITRYLKDIKEQDQVNDVIHDYFGDNLPCSTTVQIAAFVVPTMKIEIDAWAVIPARSPKSATRRASGAASRVRVGRKNSQ